VIVFVRALWTMAERQNSAMHTESPITVLPVESLRHRPGDPRRYLCGNIDIPAGIDGLFA